MNLSQESAARQFLARVVPWADPVTGQGYVNLHSMHPNPDTTSKIKKFHSGTILRAPGDVDQSIAYLTNRNPQTDIYFCTSLQGMAEEKTSQRTGRAYRAPKRSAEAALCSKAIFLDIDFKGYADPKDVTRELSRFLSETGMPEPTAIVFSGGGLHVYWIVNEPLTPSEWLELSGCLVQATIEHNLKCDRGVTIDIARILRVPGTLNHKYDPPVAVKLLRMREFDYLVDQLRKPLFAYKDRATMPKAVGFFEEPGTLPRAPLQGVSDLEAGVESTSDPIILDTIAPVCPMIAVALADGGKDYDNPTWNMTTLISVFTSGGRADAHRMAMGHSDYTPEATDDLFDRKQADHVTKNLGWPSCASIANNCRHCSYCPNKALGKSPLSFGQRQSRLQAQALVSSVAAQPGVATVLNIAATTPTGPGSPTGAGINEPDLPQDYIRSGNGIVQKMVLGEDGLMRMVPVLMYQMTNPWVEKNPWVLNFTTSTENGKTSNVRVALEDITTNEFRRVMQAQGIMLPFDPKLYKEVMVFMQSWIAKLQQQKDRVLQSVPFGWAVADGKLQGFVYGGVKYTPLGDEAASNTDPELSRQFTPIGDIQPWKDCADMITAQGRPELDAILASSFAGPLVRFTGHAGLLMSAFSTQSGIGKSTALKAAQAVWGDPKRAVQSLSDTQNSVINKLGELRSLPIYWDELKTEKDSQSFINTVFQLTQGKEKSRLTTGIRQRAPGTWQTIMVSASNDSLMDTLRDTTRVTSAGLYRVFEFTVKPPQTGLGQIDPTVAQRMVSKMDDNFGRVGQEYAKFLGQNFVQVEQDLATMLSDLGKEVKMIADERFWISLIGTVLLGARYGNQMGFTKIDEVALKSFLLQVLAAQRANINKSVDAQTQFDIVSLVGRYLNEMRARHTVNTDNIYSGHGRVPVGTVKLIGDHSRVEAVYAHIGHKSGVILISTTHLREWLKNHGVPRQIILTSLNRELGAQDVRARLGAGTIFAATAGENCIQIDIAKSNLSNLITLEQS